jgi:redox-sensing transcriptional repressor
MALKITKTRQAPQEALAVKPAPESTIRRLLEYLDYLKGLDGETVSSAQVAEHFKFTAIQVRKDIACTECNGRPKHGYNRAELIAKIEATLGFHDKMDAFLIGAGNIGRALASYGGFAKYSLNIVAMGDNNPKLHNTKINGKAVFSMEKTAELIKRMKIKMAIIAVPAPGNQQAADILTKAGVKAIWNFSSARLKCAEDIIVQNEDLGASLSVLSQKLLVAEQDKRKQKNSN